MAKTNISNEEKEILQSYIKTSPLVLVRFKAQAILLAANGVRTQTIATSMGKTERTVSNWLSSWRKWRVSSVFTGHQDNNNAAKLTKEQKQQIKEVLQVPPSDHGLPKEFWSVPQLKSYIEAAFGAVYECRQSYHFLLKFSNLSFKYPDTFDRKRNEELINERMQSIREEIKPLFYRDDWEVFAVDEVRMDQEAIIRRAWLKKGKRTVIKVNRNKESQSYIGFLNQKNFKCHLYEMEGMQNSQTVLKAMGQFLKEYPDKHIAIIWDNAPFHKSKQIRNELKKGGIIERVHLIAMPPYAPDENPIEKVWVATKQKIANIQHDTFEETKRAFSDYVASRTFRYSFC
jgi:transposase